MLRVSGVEVVVPDTPFTLLLRLVVALWETHDGFVDLGRSMVGGGLIGEGYFTEEGIYEALDRLRKPFRNALGKLPTTKFIEVKSRRVRLSTHVKYINIDRAALSEHSNALVRRLGLRLCSLVDVV